jgi:LPXTG-site transpeptidase (sortase) family protein
VTARVEATAQANARAAEAASVARRAREAEESRARAEARERAEREARRERAERLALASPARPRRLVIWNDRLKLSAPVEYVGLTSEGAMDAPDGWWNAGWYTGGARPGEKGNAVMAAHNSSDGGGDALFTELDRLRVGDRVSVVDRLGNIFRFRVRDVDIYYETNAPLNDIFGPDHERDLNLITCSGRWQRSTGRWDQRRVVYTRLYEVIPATERRP